MKKIKRVTATVTATALAIALQSALASLTASATNVNFDFNVTWNFRTTDSRESTVYIDPDDLKNGDYMFNAALYMVSDQELPEQMAFVNARWDGYDSNEESTRFVRFANMSTMRDTNVNFADDFNIDGLNPDGSIANTDFVIKYAPTCFSTLRTHGNQTTLTTVWTCITSKYATSYESTAIYSAGPYKIKYKDANGEWVTYDVTWDEKTGTATTIDYIENDIYPKPMQLKIDDYDPELPEGEVFMDSCDYLTAHNVYDDVKNEWFGGKSDAFPFVSFDVVIDQDTPEGVYYVGFKNCNNKGELTEDSNVICCDLFGERPFGTYHYPDNLMPIFKEEDNYDSSNIVDRTNNHDNWLKIIVGNPEENTPQNNDSPVSYDINNDGLVDIADASETLKIYAEETACLSTEAPIYKDSAVNADINEDGIVDMTDATEILSHYARITAGLITE